MINFEDALRCDDVDKKSQFVESYIEALKRGEHLDLEVSSPNIFKEPSYSKICKIVDPKDLPARKNLHTQEGLAILIHAILHIEYSAIDLALDAVYRFRDMPQEYKMDWMVVADDEIRHFKMLESILKELGYKYGDFTVHCGLFDAANHTRDDLLDRMAIIPRYYEASGLDVNPQIIKKLENQKKDPLVSRIIDALNLIYCEEIEHVFKGDKWFKYICQDRNLEPKETY